MGAYNENKNQAEANITAVMAQLTILGGYISFVLHFKPSASSVRYSGKKEGKCSRGRAVLTSEL
ncbi:hypothetical protein BD410DRAFT_155717 [Rickenella mellea]|uniref:Uncharacterized protein n=1 Tax=Rickenella mellea TaxID=50990 RepID=A0A4Y7PIE9_9AGAM|nr:hypothetical protein BD410DRAFT_155717 [Rickenella mellea]